MRWGPPSPALSGDDPGHFANIGLRFSFIATGSVHTYDQVRRQAGTITGTPVSRVAPIIGKAWKAGTTTAQAAFSGRYTTQPDSNTFAAIVSYTTTTGVQCIFSTGSADNSGWIFVVGDAGTALFGITAPNVAAISSGIALTAGHQYLLIASTSTAANVTNFLVCDLLSGRIQTASSTSATPVAPGGTFLLGNDGGSQPWAGAISHAMHSTGLLMSVGAMIQWARPDPWGPWRLPQPRKLGFRALATSAALSARAFFFLRGSALPSGTTPLLGSDTTAATARATPSGTAPLIARGEAALRISGAMQVGAALYARLLATLAGRANSAGTTSIAARGLNAARASALPAGTTPLQSRSTTAARAAAALAALVALSGRGLTTPRATASSAGAAGLAARALTLLRGRVLTSGTAGLAARGITALRARAAPGGTVGLLARSLSTLRASALPQGIANLVALGGAALTALRTSAGIAGLTALHGSSRAAASIRGALARTAALFGRGTSSTSGRAAPSGSAPLAVRILTLTRTQASPTGEAPLSASGTTAGTTGGAIGIGGSIANYLAATPLWRLVRRR